MDVAPKQAHPPHAMPHESKISPTEWRHQPKLLRSGHLAVSSSPRHEVYWEEHGRADGEPVMFLHGGPGGACSPELARFFDPARYRVVLFDQRGCGKSRPSASDADAAPALADNTTPHLVRDVLALREHLGIQGKMHVFGGSWGSTFGLAYAIAHPDTVASLVLRGIFLCRQKDLDYFYQGNAATYAKDAHDTSLPGTYQFFPEAWKRYVEVIPPAERGDMVAAYARIFATTPTTDEAHARVTEAALAWSIWEGVTSYLAQDVSNLGKFAEPEFAKAFARIENHYFMNGCFLGEGRNRGQNHILQNLARLRGLDVHVVHGRYDVVCPLFGATELVARLGDVGVPVDFRVTAAGHSMQDRENHRALTDVMDGLPRLG